MNSKESKKSKKGAKASDISNERSLNKRNLLIICVLAFFFILSLMLGIFFSKNPIDLTSFFDPKTDEELIIQKLRTIEKSSYSKQTSPVTPLSLALVESIISDGPYQSNIELFRFGDEFFTSDDVNFYLFLIDAQSVRSATSPTDSELFDLIDKMKVDSVLLQNYAEQYAFEEYILFEKGSDRNAQIYINRENAVLDISASFDYQTTGNISGEGVTLWFAGNEGVQVDEEAAQNMAKLALEKYRLDLARDVVDMEIVGEFMTRDDIVQTLNPGISASPYFKFSTTRSSGYFDAYDDVESIWDLKPGEVSPVLLGYSTIDGARVPAFYSLIAIDTIQGDLTDLSEELGTELQSYEIELLFEK